MSIYLSIYLFIHPSMFAVVFLKFAHFPHLCISKIYYYLLLLNIYEYIMPEKNNRDKCYRISFFKETFH